MVLSTDDGQKCQCPVCKGVIKHKEQGGVVDDGRNLRHTDCIRDKYGYEAAKDQRWLIEMERSSTERERNIVRVQRWLNFKNLPPGKYGARKVA